MIVLSKSINANLIVGLFLLVVIASAALFVITKFQSSTILHLGDGVFDARIANTQSAREKGLGGVSYLKPNQALILAFNSDDIWRIWMKDMKIPIDIIWLDNNKRVIYIVKNASPDTSTDVIYEPKTNARYVVEVPAGTVDSKTIRTGVAAIFDITEEDIK